MNREQKTEDRQESNNQKATTNVAGAFEELERGIYAALETYSNVHRGSGHKSPPLTRPRKRLNKDSLPKLEVGVK